MRPKHVGLKVFFVVLLPLIALVGTLLLLQIHYFSSSYVAQKERSFMYTVQQIASELKGSDLSNGDIVAKIRVLENETAATLRLFVPQSEVEGRMRFSVFANEDNISTELSAFLERLAESFNADQTGHYPQVIQEDNIEYLVCVKNIEINGGTGILSIAASLQPVDDAVKTLKDLSWLIYIVAFLFSIALAFILSRIVTRPLLKEIEREQSLDKMRRDFIANASHEMKTPISIISGYAESMIDGILSENERTEYEQAIYDESQKMGKLVKDMLEMALLQNESNEPHKEQFAMIDVINQIITRLCQQIKEKNINAIVNAEAAICIIADKSMIETAAINLITNAIYHTPPNGSISIKLTQNEQNVHFSVENEGEPIPENALTHIWESFYRVDKSHNREGGRFGLGLATVKAIVEKHGGKAKCENMKNGVLFTLSIPIID